MARILVVTQKAEDGRNLGKLLRRDGHGTHIVPSSSEAGRSLASGWPDLVVLSVPDPPGLLRELGRIDRAGLRRTPAIAVVPEGPHTEAERDLPGLLEFLPTPFSSESFLAHVDALLRVREVLFDRHGQGSLPSSARGEGGVTLGPPAAHGALRGWLDVLLGRTPFQKERPLEPYLETAASIVGLVEGRDAFDPGHGQRVASHCAAIAQPLGVRGEELAMLLYAAAVHDIGKIVLSADLLKKPSLSDGDRKLMRFHPRRGAELIRALTPYEQAADAVYYHHERPDGTGYYGCSAADFPRPGRILAVAEVFEGMMSGVPGGTPPLTPEEAIQAIKTGSGKLYDTECVEVLAASVRPKRTAVPLSPIPGLQGVPLATPKR
jgi:HD-GYP domain-containing protein (c-di-GMP phosphodiesterase class II)